MGTTSVCRRCGQSGSALDEFISPYTGLCSECSAAEAQSMKRPALWLTIEVTPGSALEDAMHEAISLAASLHLAYVRFKFNGLDYTYYDFGKVIRFPKDSARPEIWYPESGWRSA